MRTGTIALQLARILALLALLRATGWYVDSRNQRTPPLETGELWGSWAALSLVSVLFVAVLLVGRRHRYPWAVLGVEAVLASVLAFVPPLQWVFWLGIGGGLLTALVGGFVQPLAVAWLGVVVAAGFRQLRDPRAADDRSSAGRDTPA